MLTTPLAILTTHWALDVLCLRVASVLLMLRLSACQEPSDVAHVVQCASERSSDSLKARLPHAGHEKMIMKSPTRPTRHPTQTRPTALLRRVINVLLARPMT